MKKLDKNKLSHQFIAVVLNNFYICVAMLMIVFAFFAWTIGVSPAQEILAVVAMLFYICTLYIKANEMGTHDRKEYSLLKPDIKKPFIWAGAIIAITYVLYILYAIVARDGSGAPIWLRIVVSTLFNTWTVPYMGIMGAARGRIMIYSHLFFIIIPLVGTVPGYIAGKNKVYVSDWFRRIMYKKEK